MAAEYETTIGLEIHAELRTRTKMFCASLNDPDEERPNVNICPVCLAHPGTLPVINREAVRQVLRVGAALGSTLADYTEFDRKNYFYPDLPKGYQITQFLYPLVSGGNLLNVQITRIHLEEDTASSIHDDTSGSTLIDYNRSGVPLMELVTEPVIRSAEQAGAFARELQLLLRALGASDANMEKGQMRVEANVSVAPKGSRSSAYVEIKNLNSFKAMERAVAYEIKRQQGMLDRGEPLIKQTLGWDEQKQATFPQRSKEGSADYRYFPDPDIPSLRLSEVEGLSLEQLQRGLPELPGQKRERYLEMGISQEDAEMYLRSEKLAGFFEEVTQGEMDKTFIKIISNYIANDMVKIIRDMGIRDTENKEISDIRVPILAENFKYVLALLKQSKLSSRAVKDVLLESVTAGVDPREIIESKGLLVERTEADIEAIVAGIISDNPAAVSEFKSGKLNALEFLLGKCMKELKGSGNPVTLRATLIDLLSR